MENLENKVVEILTKSVELAEKTGEFVIDQGNEVIQQFFQWQLATYGEEVTIGGTPQSDRRGLFKMAIRF